MKTHTIQRLKLAENEPPIPSGCPQNDSEGYGEAPQAPNAAPSPCSAEFRAIMLAAGRLDSVLAMRQAGTLDELAWIYNGEVSEL